MTKLFSIKLKEDDISRIESLKKTYGFKTTAQLIKHLILWHYLFWEDERKWTSKKN